MDGASIACDSKFILLNPADQSTPTGSARTDKDSTRHSAQSDPAQ